jgi:hypothetical protein
MSTPVVRTCQWKASLEGEVIDCVGGVISPLLANLYLHWMDWTVARDRSCYQQVP